MKLFKCFIIIFVLLFFSGCTKEYRLYINDNNIVEKFHMEIDSDNEYSYILERDFYPLHNNFRNIYNKNLKNKGNINILDLEYTYSLNDFINANSFNQCFDDRNIINDENFYSINLSKPNACMFNTDYVINIITDNKVIENNANEIKGNKYIWYVTNDNKSNFELNIKIQKGSAKNRLEKYSFVAYIFVGVVIVSIIIGIFVFIKRNKKSKQI